MFKRFLAATSASLLLLTLPSCIDENYDLENIDTDVQFKVNNLTLPLNIQDIAFGDFIEPSGNLQVMNGEYVFTESGEFNSSEICIDAIHVDAPKDVVTTTTFSLLPENLPVVIEGLMLPESSYDLHDAIHENYEYSTDVDTDIKNIDAVEVNTHVKFSLSIEGAVIDDEKVYIQNFEMHVPKCLEMDVYVNDKLRPGCYDADKGVVAVDYVHAEDHALSIEFFIHKVFINNNSTAKYYDGHFEIIDDISIINGELMFAKGAIQGNAPEFLKLETTAHFTELTVSKFWGSIDYNYDFNIDPIAINDLPDFLGQNGTKLILANPQVYLSVNNPVHQYGLTGFAKLSITPERESIARQTISMPEPLILEAKPGRQAFCLSPSAEGINVPTDIFEGMPIYDNPLHVPFPGLSRVLDCNGIPDRLNISINAGITPESKVDGFELGVNHGAVNGYYKLVAPVALSADSEITYSDESTDWDSDMLRDLVIEHIGIQADIVNESPFAVEIAGYPLRKIGAERWEQIDNVEVVGTTIEPGTTSKLNIQTKGGKITNLDGFNFTAKLKSNGKGVLSPEQKVKLSNIRVKVSGNYTTEL